MFSPICPYVLYVSASVAVGMAFRGGVRHRRGTTCLDGHCLRDHALATRQVRYLRFFWGKNMHFLKKRNLQELGINPIFQSWSRNFRIEVGVPGKLGVNESKKTDIHRQKWKWSPPIESRCSSNLIVSGNTMWPVGTGLREWVSDLAWVRRVLTVLPFQFCTRTIWD